MTDDFLEIRHGPLSRSRNLRLSDVLKRSFGKRLLRFPKGRRRERHSSPLSRRSYQPSVPCRRRTLPGLVPSDRHSQPLLITQSLPINASKPGTPPPRQLSHLGLQAKTNSTPHPAERNLRGYLVDMSGPTHLPTSVLCLRLELAKAFPRVLQHSIGWTIPQPRPEPPKVIPRVPQHSIG